MYHNWSINACAFLVCSLIQVPGQTCNETLWWHNELPVQENIGHHFEGAISLPE